jgi:crotonobetainyl-CoA hydratase
VSVTTERRGPVLVITLDRPEARNAINLETARALADAVELLNSDDELRVGVLTGTGPAFCAGQDLKALAAGEPIRLPEHPEWGFAGFTSHASDKPIIAAVNGFAFGGGFELALACDLIVASTEARFALPEATRGLIAGGGGLPRVAQQLPPKVAARLVYTGEPMSAADAERWGLVTQVVEPEGLMDAALALADSIAATAPLAVQASKRLLTRLAYESAFDASVEGAVAEEFAAVSGSVDAAEGVAAFVEKRTPVWSGR